MFRFLPILVPCLGFVLSNVDWVSKAQVPNPSGYFSKVVQELVYDLEKLEWCNLKVDNYTQTLNEQIYHTHVKGKVIYANGFVISIQLLDLTNFEQIVFSRTVDGARVPHATVRGWLNMRNVSIGFDVLVELEAEHEEQRYTGQYTHEIIQLQLEVTRNLLTKEMTSSPYLLSIRAGTGADARMIYMPANNVTEALSRTYQQSLNGDAVTKWCRDIIGPILVDVSTNRIKFPDICFNNCPK